MTIRSLRNGAIISFVVSLGILLFGGYFARDKIPPIPGRVSAGAAVLMDHASILRGQDVYQQHGLMDHGSVWGHGTLRGMDFSAHSLHKIGELMRDFHAAGGHPAPGAYAALPAEKKREVDVQVIEEMRLNRYDAQTDTLTLTPAQAYAVQQVRAYWDTVFGAGEPHYGFRKDTIVSADQRRDLADFFFWSAWAAGTARPHEKSSYTNNWPPDVSVGNTPTAETFIWSIASVLSLFVVLGLVIFLVHRYQLTYGDVPAVDVAGKLLKMPLTPSQCAAAKFFLVAGLLFVVQIMNGGLMAHYTVHPESFYIKWLGEVYSYSWAKTWHLQLAVFWIAISWIGAAVFLAPLIGGREPRGQRALVNILFVAAFLVVVGSLTGEVLGIKDKLGNAWFWLGHQGWEYLELGRLWQILLWGGLLFWVAIIYRGMPAVLKGRDTPPEQKGLVAFYLLSALFVVGFFGFGLMYGRGTHPSIADYWRWFVVHIWVESIFEFFGIAVICMFLVTLGLVTAKSAVRVAYFSAILVFLSGIPGTAHHYFWYGGPSLWLAIGGVFSSMEPVPLILLVVRAWMEHRSIRAAGREFPFRWPFYFLVASSVWNFIGAGVFGFLINLPIVNYYEHATYMTSNHGHAALFGVYGMLAISVLLFSWRILLKDNHWNDRILKLSFWGLNGGLALMSLTSLLPMGVLQVWHSYVDGFWMARSAAFYELAVVQRIATWRMVPDFIIILFGALPLLWFLVSTFPHLRKAGERG